MFEYLFQSWWSCLEGCGTFSGWDLDGESGLLGVSLEVLYLGPGFCLLPAFQIGLHHDQLASCSCSCAFPSCCHVFTMMDCIPLNCKPKVNPSSCKWLPVRYLITLTRKVVIMYLREMASLSPLYGLKRGRFGVPVTSLVNMLVLILKNTS